MRLLLVAATEQEIAPLLKVLVYRGADKNGLKWYERNGKFIYVLITGVGMVATAARVSKVLANATFAEVINAGICGSFTKEIVIGEVVYVETDIMPELGAEDGESFISIHDLNLLDKNEPPYVEGWLRGGGAGMFGVLSELKSVHGVTVNKVHGNEASIKEFTKRCSAHVESMEGAGFYYACSLANVYALQIRAVSNYVERRNRDNWNIAEAIKNLNEFLLKYLDAK